MKKSFKKTLALIMAFTFIFGCTSFLNLSDVAFAAETKTSEDGLYEYKIIAGMASISKYNGDSENVEIPEMIDGKRVVWINQHAFENNDNIVSVIMNENLQGIGRSAFLGCNNLKSVTIPDSVFVIEESAFDSCANLLNVNISENSKLKTIEDKAFSFCTNLKNIFIPDSVKKLGSEVFFDCESLTNITGFNCVEFVGSDPFNGTKIYDGEDFYTWHNYNTYGELYVGNYLVAVRNCSNEYEVRNGTKIIGNNAFYNGNITKVILPEGLKRIESGAFERCTGLGEINIPASVEFIGSSAFGNCSALETVNFSEKSTIKEIGAEAFANCEKLKELNIPDGVESIGYRMFSGTKVTEITLPDSVYYVGDLMCDSLTKIIFSGDVTVRITDSMVTSPENVEVEVLDGAKEICEYAFFNQTFKNVKIPDSIEIIGYMAFDDNGIEKLSSTDDYGNKYIGKCIVEANPNNKGEVVIRNDTVSVMPWAFRECAEITKLSGFGNVTHIGAKAFFGCNKLTEIDNLNSVKHLGSNAFEECFELSEIGNLNSLESIAMGVGSVETLFYNTKLIDEDGYVGTCLAKAPQKTDGVFKIKEGTRFIAPRAFSSNNCTNVIIPDSVVYIGEEAFSSCDSIEKIVLPGSVKQIGASAFVLCDSLKSVIICDGVEKIGDSPFYRCMNLELVHIPSSVSEMGYDVLSHQTDSPYSEDKIFACFDTPDTYAENYVVENGVPFIYCDGNHITEDEPEVPDIPEIPDKPETAVIEKISSAGIKVEYDSSYFDDNDNVILKAEEKDGMGGNVGEYDENRIKIKRYDIHLEDKDGNIIGNDKDGREYTVRIPVPAGYGHYTQFLIRHRMTRADGTTENENILAEVKDGYIVFKTKCFSYFDVCDFGFEKESVSLEYKSGVTLTATKIADSGIKYSSSNPKVATVDENGNVTTHGRGTAIITATFEFENGETITDTCTVNVNFTFVQWIIYIFLLGFLWY